MLTKKWRPRQELQRNDRYIIHGGVNKKGTKSRTEELEIGRKNSCSSCFDFVFLLFWELKEIYENMNIDICGHSWSRYDNGERERMQNNFFKKKKNQCRQIIWYSNTYPRKNIFYGWNYFPTVNDRQIYCRRPLLKSIYGLGFLLKKIVGVDAVSGISEMVDPASDISEIAGAASNCDETK